MNLINPSNILDINPVTFKIMKNTQEIIESLTINIGERSVVRHDNLFAAQTYIYKEMKQHASEPVIEEFELDGIRTANVYAEVKGALYPEHVIIIGAHYDTIEGSVGANDNATGIAALLELYRMFSKENPARTIRFIAFSAEEPPYFSTDKMGSMIHAKNCRAKNEQIDLMISLDMLGIGGNFKKQEYPEGIPSENYPTTGNFVATIALPSSSQHVFLWKKIFNNHSKIPTHELIAPASVKGVSLSDHTSFHKHEYPALMITDTGYFRDKNYHTENDTIDSINFRFLAQTIQGIYKTLEEIANMENLP